MIDMRSAGRDRRSTVIEGSTQLPGGFHHPHASEDARRIAEEGMVLRVQVGSGVHGTSVQGQGQRHTVWDQPGGLANRSGPGERQLAQREHGLGLGLDALVDFVERRPLRQGHQAVFAVLALEPEPVDPRR